MYVDVNNIGEKGCLHLSLANINNLITLHLGINCIKQAKIMSEMMDVGTFRRVSGLTSNNYTSVAVLKCRYQQYHREGLRLS